VIETVTEQVIIEEDAANPVYQTETKQQIVTPRQDTWFETPCDEAMTPDFNASVQRALKARGHYRGPITGRMDGRTRAAIRAYQKPQGLDSGMLSLAAARQMGLMQVDLQNAGVPVEEPGASDISVAILDDKTDVAAPVAESAAAEAARLAEEQAAERVAQAERDKERLAAEAAKAVEAERLAREQAAAKAEADARAAEAARIADAERAAEQARAAEAARVAAEEREKNKRAKELAQALEDEKKRTGGTVFEPLPISSESY
jgi:hypothetical protein